MPLAAGLTPSGRAAILTGRMGDPIVGPTTGGTGRVDGGITQEVLDGSTASDSKLGAALQLDGEAMWGLCSEGAHDDDASIRGLGECESPISAAQAAVATDVRLTVDRRPTTSNA